MGAEVVYLEEVESGLVRKIEEVNRKWGGDFHVKELDWKTAIRSAKEEGRVTVHLTMYGLPIYKKMEELRNYNDFLLMVGGPKVPSEMYQLADFNISVTLQPHSEIAALAIFMHELQKGEELKREFQHSKMKIVPREKGKQVELML
jgi:tRNA (cytidine56-2'-O)-methyltransferase